MAIVNQFPGQFPGRSKDIAEKKLIGRTDRILMSVISESNSDRIGDVYSSISNYSSPSNNYSLMGCTLNSTFSNTSNGTYRIKVLSKSSSSSYGFMFGAETKGTKPSLNPSYGYGINNNNLSVDDEFVVVIENGHAKLYDKQGTLLSDVSISNLVSTKMLYIAAAVVI